VALNGASASFGRQLKEYQAVQQGQRDETRQINAYVDKLRYGFGRKGTLFSEVQGFLPAGQMDEEDRKMGAMLLASFRHKAFVRELRKGLADLERETSSLVERTGKKVAELMQRSSTANTEELSALVIDFFKKENHVLGSYLEKVAGPAKAMLAALPGHGTPTGQIAADLLAKLVAHASAALNNGTQAIVASKGAKFCGGMDIFFLDQVVPALNRTAGALPKLEEFARAEAPDVAKDVRRYSQRLASVLTSLSAKLGAQAQDWFEKVCGLQGAAHTA